MTPYVSSSLAGSSKHPLTDATQCVVSKSSDGKCVLKLNCVIGGLNAEKLVCGNLVFAKTCRADSTEYCFRISKVTQNIDGIVSIEAYQFTYWLSRYPVKPFAKSMRTPKEAIDALI